MTFYVSAQSSLSIFAQKHLCKWEDAYFILQNKYLCINEDSFGAKKLRDECPFNVYFCKKNCAHSAVVTIQTWKRL